MRKLVVGIAIGASAFLATIGLAWLGVFDDVELTAFDRRLIATHTPADASKDIVIIEINESSMDALEPVFGRWPWPRMVHAGVVDFVARAGAKVITYDVLFVDEDRRGAFPVGDRVMSGAESDALLVESVGRAGNVILASNVTFQGLESDTGPIPPAPPIPGITY